MREFRAYEYVDGDLRIYFRREGQNDSQWHDAGLVRFERRGQVTVPALARSLGLDLNGVETQRLANELFNPRRH